MTERFQGLRTSHRHAVAAIIVLALAGCDQIGFHGASSMRVEVEVYKGPLSKTIDVQQAELEAKIIDSELALDALKGEIEVSMCRLGCFDKIEKSAETFDLGAFVKSDRKKHITKPLSGDTCIAPNGNRTDKSCFKVVDRKKRFFDDRFNYTLRRADAPDICRKFPEGVPSRPLRGDGEYKICGLYHEMRTDAKNLVKAANGFLRKSDPLRAEFNPPQDEYPLRYPTGFEPPVAEAPDAETKSYSTYKKNSIELARHAALYGQKLRTRAAYWAVDHIAVEPDSGRVRIDMANFAQFAAEYGNQITARSDALLWQVRKAIADTNNYPVRTSPAGAPMPRNAHGSPGIDVAKRLALSLYLRDSSTTDYLNLYDWNRAAVDASRESSATGQTPTDRVRLVERLVSDTYWSKINTVYGSGQGDVSMALIKDDIGNWNLKNFSADPTELLETYNQLARSTVQAAAQLAVGPAEGASRSAQLLGLANSLATGRSPADSAFGQLKVGNLHARTIQRLQSVQAALKARAKTLDDEIVKLGNEKKAVEGDIQKKEQERDTLEKKPAPRSADDQNKINDLNLEIGGLKEKLRGIEGKIEEAGKNREALKTEAVRSARDVVRDHAAIIEAMQDSLVQPAAASGTAAPVLPATPPEGLPAVPNIGN